MSVTPSRPPLIPSQSIAPAVSSPVAIRAYLGGSFDPIHFGHLQMAMTVYDQLVPFAHRAGQKLQVSLLPNARSPFKQHSSEPSHRLAMLELATMDTPLEISTLELWQPPPVYSIDTVRTLRQRYPNDVLIFIMGADSAASLPRWKEGLELIHYVHLWVFQRHSETGSEHAEITRLLPPELQPFVTTEITDLISPPHQPAGIDLGSGANISSETDSKGDWQHEPIFKPLTLKSMDKGRIYLDNTDILAVSSSQIRSQIQKQPTDPLIGKRHHPRSTPSATLPIQQGISQTKASQGIIAKNDTNLVLIDKLNAKADELLPTAVYEYIRQHGLYC